MGTGAPRRVAHQQYPVGIPGLSVAWGGPDGERDPLGSNVGQCSARPGPSGSVWEDGRDALRASIERTGFGLSLLVAGGYPPKASTAGLLCLDSTPVGKSPRTEAIARKSAFPSVVLKNL